MDSPNDFEVLRMLNAFARSEGISLDHVNYERFFEKWREALAQHKQRATLMHGLRIQSMFLYVVAALGGCAIITEEDRGEFYALGSNIKRPDFRILLNDGQEFFVEVKNFCPKNPEKPYRLTEAYLSKLRQYADRFQRDLKIAIYWPQWKNMWTMVPVDKFLLQGTHRCISFPDAMIANEMSLLGDCMIATTPPLGLRFYTDSDNPPTVEADGSVACKFKRGTLYCGEQEIEDSFEESLAWFFINYGNWVEDKAPAVIEEGKLISIEIPFIPEERDNPDQPFEGIGFLSQMIFRQYNELTAPGGHIDFLSPERPPDQLGILIPLDYEGRALPLWRFLWQWVSENKV